MEKNTNLATSSTSAAQDTSKNCQVTNQTSSDAVVIIPTTSQDGSNDSSIAVYDQNLEILATLEGGTVIKVGQRGTVVLDQYYNDPKTGQKNLLIGV
jgi:hypothetical protein